MKPHSSSALKKKKKGSKVLAPSKIAPQRVTYSSSKTFTSAFSAVEGGEGAEKGLLACWWRYEGVLILPLLV